ncbi:MAG: hypothetical protein HW415_1737 [Deltaproteobacteria bacterium]|nr:hypothetical protein [Deltaproteobacteria bacterium]
MVPPSTHLSGAEYKWVEGHNLGEKELILLPDVFLQKVAEGTTNKPLLKELYKGVAEGGRNHALARLVGSWIEKGMTLEECVESAAIWNQRNSQALTMHEVET